MKIEPRSIEAEERLIALDRLDRVELIILEGFTMTVTGYGIRRVLGADMKVSAWARELMKRHILVLIDETAIGERVFPAGLYLFTTMLDQHNMISGLGMPLLPYMRTIDLIFAPDRH